LLEIGFDAEAVRGIHENARVLGRNDGFDNVGDVVYVGKGLYAEEDIIERLLGSMGGVFRCSDHCGRGWSAVGSTRVQVGIRTSVGLKPLVAVESGSAWTVSKREASAAAAVAGYLKVMPYWATLSKPDFQTRVTSQALVACRRHDRKAETAFPPTVQR